MGLRLVLRNLSPIYPSSETKFSLFKHPFLSIFGNNNHLITFLFFFKMPLPRVNYIVLLEAFTSAYKITLTLISKLSERFALARAISHP